MKVYPPNSLPHPQKSDEQLAREAERWEVSKAGILARREKLAELLIQVEDCLAASEPFEPGDLTLVD